MRPLIWDQIPLWGPQLIEASAGTGKTFTLTSLILRLIVERELRIEQILVVTFTNAATAELRDRVRRRLRQAASAFAGQPTSDPQIQQMVAASQNRELDHHRLIDALRGIDQSAIHTIHGFCQRILTEYAFESGIPFDLELLPEIRQLLAEVVDDYWAREVYLAREEVVRYYEKTGASRRMLMDLAHRVVAEPDMEIVLPTAPARATGDLEAALHAYQQAHQAAQLVWVKGRSEIKNLLCSEALNKTKYSLKGIPSWCVEMDTLLGDPMEGAGGLFEKFEKFTPPLLAAGVNKGRTPPSHPFFPLCSALQESASQLSAELDRLRVELIARFIPYVREELAARKLKARRQSFDDLLHRLRRVLRGPNGQALASNIRQRYPAALVDEFQDTDPGQYQVLRQIWSGPEISLFLIGDPKQAIYAFRGADVFAYLAAARDAAQAAYTLTTNYRSDPSLVGALNLLYQRTNHPFLIPEIRYEQVRARDGASDRLVLAGQAQSALEFLFVPATGRAGRRDEKTIPKRKAGGIIQEAITTSVLRLLHSGAQLDGRPVEPGDMAVLTRTNADAAAMHRALRRAGVDSVLQGDSSVLDSPEAQEMAWLLRALAEPTRVSAIRVALATRILGITATALEHMQETEREWENWVEAFRRWHSLWERRGLSQALRRLFRDQQVIPRLLGQTDGERSLTNLLHLTELLHEAETRENLGLAGLLQWFEEARHDESARDQVAREAVQVRLESDTKKLKITTIHQSKGLEYGIVYLPFLWDSASLRDKQKKLLTFHDPDSSYTIKLDLRSISEKDRELELAAQEALGEALRIAYVALTRARHKVIVVAGGFQSYAGSPLAWLLHHPDVAPGSGFTSPGQRLHQAGDALLFGDLQNLAGLSQGSISVEAVGNQALPPFEPVSALPPTMRARTLAQRLEGRFRISSFSALAAGDHAAPDSTLQWVDHEDALTLTPPADREPTEPVALNDFPRGPGPGNLLHAILERWDYLPEAAESRQLILNEELTRHKVPLVPWAELARKALEAVLATPLNPAGLRLCNISQAQRLNEMEFTFPISPQSKDSPARSDAAAGSASPPPPDPWLTARLLAEPFRRWAAPPVPADYWERLSRLAFLPLSGFLRGFIDLVFEDQGRYYVVDWKSNHLGPQLEDYQAESLLPPMVESHYILQYHIYLVALHRLLKLRLPDYDYDRHIGGAFYLFLRGVSPESGPKHGIYFDRPKRELIESLSLVFEGCAPAQAVHP